MGLDLAWADRRQAASNRRAGDQDLSKGLCATCSSERSLRSRLSIRSREPASKRASPVRPPSVSTSVHELLQVRLPLRVLRSIRWARLSDVDDAFTDSHG